MASRNDWYLREGERVTGPLSARELSERLRGYDYDDPAFVRQGQGKWYDADAVRQRFEQLHRSGWFVRVGRHRFGPYVPRRLVQIFDSNRFPADAYVRQGQEGRWIEARVILPIVRKACRTAPPGASDPLQGLATAPDAPAVPAPAMARDSDGEKRGDVPVFPSPDKGAGQPIAEMPIVVDTEPKAVRRAPRGARRFPVYPVGAALLLVCCVPLVLHVALPAGLGDLVPAALRSRKQIISDAKVSVAQVIGTEASGTGFMVSPRLMLTNRHVVESTTNRLLKVRFPADSGGSAPLSAKVIYESDALDVAVLEVAAARPPLRLATNFVFEPGEEVTIIGNPGIGEEILPNAVSTGILSTLSRLDDQDFFQLDITINPGNSGGPVIDGRGRVIAMATARASEQERLAFCVPLEDLQTELERALGLDAKERAANAALHDAKATAVVLVYVGAAYLEAANTIFEGLDGAAKLRLFREIAPEEAQRHGRQLVDFAKGHMAGGLGSDVTAVANDPNVPGVVRQRITDLWDAVSRLDQVASAEPSERSPVALPTMIKAVQDTQDALRGIEGIEWN